MGGLFQKFLNKVQQGYKEADKRVGGYLPGGGTGNPFSNNSQDLLGYAVTTTARPVQKAMGKSLGKYIQSGNWETTLKTVPSLMAEATVQMRRLGQPGIWSNDVPSTPQKSKSSLRQPLIDYSGVQLQAKQNSIVDVGPHFDFENNTVRVGPRTPPWITAHELGHAIDFHKNPDSYSYLKKMQTPEGFDKLSKNFAVQQLSPGALVVGFGSLKDGEPTSLFEAGVQGALGGLGASQHTLRLEAQADRYGMPLAKKAGTPWDHPKNILAKGSYVAAGAYPGFAQGVVGELASRGADAFGGLLGTAVRAFKGKQLSPMEQSLSKYGYDPKQHALSMKGFDEIQLKSRNQAEQALYDYITNLNKGE